MKAYYFEGEGDQRLPHEGATLSIAELGKIGVLAWTGCDEAKVDEIAAARAYKNRDVITVSREAMGDVYESKVRSFFDEHLHEDEEIRYILDGEGYFDLRDADDRWIRLAMEKGDLAVLPAGIFHRFTTAQTDYIKAMRLFKEEYVLGPPPSSRVVLTFATGQSGRRSTGTRSWRGPTSLGRITSRASLEMTLAVHARDGVDGKSGTRASSIVVSSSLSYELTVISCTCLSLPIDGPTARCAA